MKLSVLICSVHTRRNTFLPVILNELYRQYDLLSESEKNDVEIIVLQDNKKIMLGTKRNFMVDMAQGQYVVFVDDDDRINQLYLKKLLTASYNLTDCITFKALVTINGTDAKECTYSIKFEMDGNFEDRYERIPNHICAIKRELARKVNYPAIPYGEDSGFSKEIKKYLQTEHFINEVLYFYDYNSQTTEKQQHLNNRKKRLR